MSAGYSQRRRVMRVKLIEPLRGLVGSYRAYIIDASLLGLRVAHQVPIGRIGDTVSVSAEWEGRSIDVMGRIVYSILVRPGGVTTNDLRHSGLEITLIVGAAARTLRELIERHIERALDEQKANARGLPSLAPQSFQTGRRTSLVRHEYLHRNWRETPTSDSSQPLSGFTLSAEQSPGEVAMLRAAFEDAETEEARDMIRQLAALSISATDGVATRRFMP